MGNPEADDLEQGRGVVTDTVAAQVRPEDVETEPKLEVAVAGPCKNPNGLYVGLSKVQRDKIGVEVGGTVMLRKPTGEVLGIYTVGSGSKELLDQPRITANQITIGTDIEVVRANVKMEDLNNLPLVFGAEGGEKHERRSSVITERFGNQGFDGQSYLVLPTAVAKMITGQAGDKTKIASIALGKIKIGGVEKTLPIVPSEINFGMTTGAAQELGIPSGAASKIEFYFKDGALIVNQIV